MRFVGERTGGRLREWIARTYRDGEMACLPCSWYSSSPAVLSSAARSMSRTANNTASLPAGPGVTAGGTTTSAGGPMPQGSSGITPSPISRRQSPSVRKTSAALAPTGCTLSITFHTANWASSTTASSVIQTPSANSKPPWRVLTMPRPSSTSTRRASPCYSSAVVTRRRPVSGSRAAQ